MRLKLLTGRPRLLTLLGVLGILMSPMLLRAQQGTVSVNGVKTLKELVRTVESQTDYRFSYQGDIIDGHTVRVSDGQHQLAKLLTDVFANSGLKYTVRQNDILITQGSATPAPEAESRRTITGRILDAQTKQPLPGAQVWLRDTEIGVVADVDGNFSLTFNGIYSILTFSFLGYDSQDLNIGNRNHVVVELQEAAAGIDDVVVVGYGSQKKVSVIGSISSVSVQDIRQPVAKLTNALTGQIAGFMSVQRSGEPGAGANNFWIRGVSTFGENQRPLVLVDGIEREIDLVDTEDIQELSILKDAAATAVYGVKGANGVVIITTRKGEIGKPKISLKVENGFIQPTRIPKMVDAVQYAEMYNDAYGRDYYSQATIQAYRTGSDPDLYPNVNWTDKMLKNFATNQKVHLNVSGGSNIASYYIAGGFYHEDGLFEDDNVNSYKTNTSFRKFNFLANVKVKLLEYTTLNVNLGTIFERKDEPGTTAANLFKYMLMTPANAYPMYYSDGTTAGPANNEGENPYNLLNHRGYTERFWNSAQSQFGVHQDLGTWITPGLSADVKASFDVKNSHVLLRTKSTAEYEATGRDLDGNLILEQKRLGQESLNYERNNNSGSTWRTVYLQANLNYQQSFGRHSVGGLFLYQQKQQNYPAASSSEGALQYRSQGIAGRFTYDYDQRYFIEGNFGYNGSENFAPGKRFGFFPAGAAGWVISNENFFGDLRDVVSLLKLRGSYGKVGNDQIGGGRRFIYLGTTENGGSWIFGESQRSHSSKRLGEWPNEYVSWEESTKLNVGLEITLFNSLKLQGDYFTDKRRGIFTQRNSLPWFTGLNNQPYVNVGKMDNKGFDSSLEYHKRVGEWNLTARGNFTYARNKLIDTDQPDWEYLYMNRVGSPRWQRFGYVAAGLFVDQADIDAWPTQQVGGTPQPGDIKYYDLNGDGVIDSYDTKAIGWRDVPEIMYGFGFSATWRGFDAAVFFQGVANVDINLIDSNNSTMALAFSTSKATEGNVFADIYRNYWTESNPDPTARYPRVTAGTNTNNSQTSTFWLRNANYLKLKTAEVGYTLPRDLTRKWGIDALRIYLQGMNLLTFSPFKLWDPDLQTGVNAYPQTRTISIGLSINL